ncbi:MAG: ATP-binding protein [Methylophilaceae bacterium]
MIRYKKTATNLALPKLGFAALRGRLIFRSVFLLLMLATLLLALIILQGERFRAHQNYHRNLMKTHATVMAKLRHPSGQLALLNPDIFQQPITPLRPLLLPYAALDFSDQNKSQQAIEVAGCSIHYANGDICVGIGSNPYAGGFIYILGKVQTTDLISREPGVLDLENVHRARISLTHQGEETHWNAPFERIEDNSNYMTKGKLTGFLTDSDLLNVKARPHKEFRGWMWQSRYCNDGFSNSCLHTTYYSIRVPVESFAQALFKKKRPQWPPKDLADYKLRVVLMPPLSSKPLFDSNAAEDVSLPYALSGLAEPLLTGETLTISSQRAEESEALKLEGPAPDAINSPYFNWLLKVLSKMPVLIQSHQLSNQPLLLADTLKHSTGNYQVSLQGNLASINRELYEMVGRLTWVVAAMLCAILIAWLLVEFSFLRRLTLLTKRAAKVSYNMQSPSDITADQDLADRIQALSLDDLNGRDEVGILANSLKGLLERIQEDVRQAQARAKQDKDMWQAVGHEIMSPLQSLMVLHPDKESQSYRYVYRMLQAVRMLYGHASPSEAVEAVNFNLEAIDLDAFISLIADNAHYAGISNVHYQAYGEPLHVNANAFSLEDALTHILNNAQRHRHEKTDIQLRLVKTEKFAEVHIENEGEPISEEKLLQIFDYGVSGDSALSTSERRGQGLFISKSYLTKMGGSISAQNVTSGVVFIIQLPLAKQPKASA